jgi:ankyrin repeat protein
MSQKSFSQIAKEGGIEAVNNFISTATKKELSQALTDVPLLKTNSGIYAVLLVDAGADVHYQDNSALKWASSLRNVSVVNILLEAGADTELKDKRFFENTPFWESVRNYYPEIVEPFLKKGRVSQNEKNYALNRTIDGLRNTKFEDRAIEIVKLLLKYGADVHYGGDVPLYTAVEINFPEMVKLLIQNGADVNGDGFIGANFLEEALSKDFYDVADLLLEGGANIDNLPPNLRKLIILN